MIFAGPAPESRAAAIGRILTWAVVGGMGTAFLVWAVTDWTLADAGAYWQAAVRLRSGAELYPPVSNVESSAVFRYSPWFAWLTVPWTFLPELVAAVAWSAILIAAGTVAIWPLIRERRFLPVAFFWPILMAISASGNVHALVVAALVHGVERRGGPLWIAAAASLKAVPLIFVLVYIGRRQWLRAITAIVLTGFLLAPMLLYDLADYPTAVGGAGLLIRWPLLYGAVGLAGVVTTVLAARTRYGWLSAATTAALTLPRFFTYDVTFLLVGTVRRARPHLRDATTRAH